MFEYKFFYIAWRMFGNRRLILVIQQNFLKVKCFAKLENWNVAKETSYRFHTIHMTILLDLSSVLIIFVFGNNLIKTSFEAKVIRSLENCFFFSIFWFYVQTMSSYHSSTQFLQKTYWYKFRLFLGWKMNKTWLFV